MIAEPEELEFDDIVPQAAPIHPEPESCQITPWFLMSLFTVAVKLWLCAGSNERLAGEMSSVMDSAVCGGGLPGGFGGSLGLMGTEAQPATSKTARHKVRELRAGASRTTCAPRIDFKAGFLRCNSRLRSGRLLRN